MYNEIRFGPPGRTLNNEEARKQLGLLRESLHKRQAVKQ